jgi:hypothetical protein
VNPSMGENSSRPGGPSEVFAKSHGKRLFSVSWGFQGLAGGVVFSLLAFFLAPHLTAKPKDSPSQVSPSFGHDIHTSVVRGESCELVLRGIVMPRDTAEFKIAKEPQHGSLEGPQRIDRESVRYIYRNNGNNGINADRVVFRLKTGPGNAWGRVTAQITIFDRPSWLDVDKEIFDFGARPIGRQSSLPLKIRNGGGGVLKGKAKIGEPWSLTESEDFRLAEGEQRQFEVVFSPTGPGEFTGLIEFQAGSKPYRSVELRGEGIYRFQVPERIKIQRKPSADFLEITNRTSEVLDLQITAPNPLLGASSIQIPAGGSERLKLELRSGTYSEKIVDLEIADGTAIRRVRVDLPASPALLEWENAPQFDVGRIPVRHVPELQVALKNAGPTNATLSLAPGKGGVRLAPSQAQEFELREGETALVNLIWNLPEELGEARAKLIAWNGGLATELELIAVVVPLESAPAGDASPEKTFPAPDPEPTKSTPKILSGAEKNELKLRMPADPRYRLQVEQGTATAIVTWNYHGPKPVKFQLERKVVERVGLDPGKVFEKRLEVPEQLPLSQVIEKWQPIGEKEASIECIDGTVWQGRVTGLQAGFHDVRIAASTPDGKRVDYAAFVVEVGKLPKPAWINWALWSALISALFLLRRTMARWFGLASDSEP